MSKQFTFQYVSIKTPVGIFTMFCPAAFTFQYVSIKTRIRDEAAHTLKEFTFQYVSIKTSPLSSLYHPQSLYLHSNMFLLRHADD